MTTNHIPDKSTRQTVLAGPQFDKGRAWAKSNGDGSRLSLADHSVDVAAIAEVLLRRPTINRRLSALAGRSLLTGADINRIGFLVGLHDAGKVVHGFQARLRSEKPDCGHIGPLWDILGGTHTETGGKVRPQVKQALGWEAWQGWFEPYDSDPERDANPICAKGVCGWYWQSILAHHGSLPAETKSPEARQWLPRNGYSPLEALAALTATLQAMFSAGFHENAGKLPGSPRFLHALAGLVTLADWLGSDQTVFRFPGEIPGIPTGEARIPWAREQAVKLLARRGLDPHQWQTGAAGTNASFAALFPGHNAPRPSQTHMLTEALPTPGQIMTLEAETGSGKTEAALAHFFRLFQAGEVDGLYFALPTRAAAVQIHGRVNRTFQRWFGRDGPPVSLAVPGYLRVDEAEGQRLPERFGVLWPDDADRDRAWSVERAKSYLSGAIMVGTVDQVLMGGLQVRHAQFRSGPMLRLLLVVDEVHASDAYMGVILRNVLDQHIAAAGHALLMSATLGAEARTVFLHVGKRGRPRPPTLAEAETLSYPAVQRQGESLQALNHDGQRKEVIADLIEPDALDPLLAQIAEAAQAGAAVLFIRNTVDGAREAFAALEELGAPMLRCAGVATPHHSRYAPEDRRRLDEALEAAFADPPDGVRKGVVAVTTQTAEQSLDICADWLVTDLCPGDVLLQRIGRLHRHKRERPAGFERARVSVIAPVAAYLAPAINPQNGEVRGRAPLGIGRVYANIVGVLATREWLARRGTLTIPADNRALVEAATHPDSLAALAAELGEPWDAHTRFVQGQTSAQGMVARLNCLKWNEPIADQPVPQDRKIMTRLGLNDRRIDLPEPLPGPFGGLVSGFNLPGWIAKDLPDEIAASEIAAAPGEIRFRLGEIRFRLGESRFVYDRMGLR